MLKISHKFFHLINCNAFYRLMCASNQPSADNHARILFSSVNSVMKAHLESNLRSKGSLAKITKIGEIRGFYQHECFHERLDKESLAFSPEHNLINAVQDPR